MLDALPEGTTVLVTSDHGGHDQTHGTERDEDMTTPFLMAGPSIAGPAVIKQAVQITDIAPTIAQFFGVAAPKEWIGESIPVSVSMTK